MVGSSSPPSNRKPPCRARPWCPYPAKPSNPPKPAGFCGCKRYVTTKMTPPSTGGVTLGFCGLETPRSGEAHGQEKVAGGLLGTKWWVACKAIDALLEEQLRTGPFRPPMNPSGVRLG